MSTGLAYNLKTGICSKRCGTVTFLAKCVSSDVWKNLDVYISESYQRSAIQKIWDQVNFRKISSWALTPFKSEANSIFLKGLLNIAGFRFYCFSWLKDFNIPWTLLTLCMVVDIRLFIAIPKCLNISFDSVFSGSELSFGIISFSKFSLTLALYVLNCL